MTADEDTREENTAGEEAAEDYADMLLTDETDSEPIDVEQYITGADLYYSTDGGKNWIKAEENPRSLE